MTKLFKNILFGTCILLTNSACKNAINRQQYKGFQNVINNNKIRSVSGKSGVKILNFNIPVAGSMSFDYNKNLTDTRFVKLERTPESAIVNIDKILLTKDRIIIADFKIARGVFIFESTGRFINSILAARDVVNKKTMISNFIDVAYDYSRDEVILHDPNKSKMYYFDKDGNYKNRTREYIYFESFANIMHTNFYVYLNSLGGNDHIPALGNSTLYFGQKDTHITFTATKAVKQMRPNVNFTINRNLSVLNSNKRIFYTPEFCDTVYEILGKPLNIYPHVVVHYPGPNINSVLKATHKEDLRNCIKLENTGQFYFFEGEILATGNGVYYLSTYKDKQYGYFYSEKTNKLLGGDLSFRGLPIDTLKSDSYSYPITTFNDYFVSIIPSSDFKKNKGTASETLAEFKNSVQPGDNPVLFYYKLKPF